MILSIDDLNDKYLFNDIYEIFRACDFIYNEFYNFIPTNSIQIVKYFEKLSKTIHPPNITKEFYNGFGNDLL